MESADKRMQLGIGSEVVVLRFGFDNKQKIENLYQSEICEIRDYSPDFSFARMYNYQRQAFYYNKRIFIVDKYHERMEASRCVCGRVITGVWSLTEERESILITFLTE